MMGRIKGMMRPALCLAVLLAGWAGPGAVAPCGAEAPGEAPAILITLDADNAPLDDVLRGLADRSQLNIVTSPEVQGETISIHLRGIPLDEALNLVVRAAGLGYERVGNSILVTSPEKLEAETGMGSQVIELQYADAFEVRELLKEVGGSVQVDVGGNRLLATGSPVVLERIRQITRELDRPQKQVLIQARLVEVVTTGLSELGIDWDKITNFKTILVEGPSDVSGPDELPDEMVYRKLDKFPPWRRQAEAFEVVLNFLIQNGNAKILADTKLTAMDNRRATIHIGDTVPIVVTSLVTGVGFGTPTPQLQTIDVGVKLDITPRISDDGYITAIVRPEVSNIVAFLGPNQDLPQTTTRETSTQVRVRNGGTIFIAGLINEEIRDSVTKVPLLGDIPILGHLFRRTVHDRLKKDLIIEITPKILEES